MKPQERRERIAAMVREATRVSVEELAQLLQTSHETVRRDLALLSERGLVRKVHGGAVHAQTALESSFGDRAATARSEKQAIGHRAAQLFQPGDSILIDSGSTTAAFAEALGKAGHFSVITNSVLVATELWKAPIRSDIYLLGGRYFGEGHETLGPLAIEEIQRLRVDHAVLTIGAIDPAGRFMDVNADETYIARAMLASARQATILADSSKLCRHALFEVCDAKQIDRLVTDRPPPSPLDDALRAAGVEVLVGEPYGKDLSWRA
jgi:DeoR family glycerol-3-phosphate regulon repressor